MIKMVSPTARSSLPGPGDQMREPGDEQGVVDRIVFPGLAAPGVHQERDLGEGVEGDADRQQDAQRRQIDAGQPTQGLQQEVGIFEEGQQAEIADDADREQQPTEPPIGDPRHAHADGVVEQDRQ